MKIFEEAELKVVTLDDEGKKQSLTLGKLIENPDILKVQAVADAVNGLTAGFPAATYAVETYHFN